MKDAPALYSSRVFRVFIDYLRTTNTEVDIQSILNSAGMSAADLADSGHWFTQQQSDRFYAALVESTGDPNIARKAGRYSASAEGISIVKQYIVGLMTTEVALLSLKKLSPLLTKHAVITAKRLGSKRIEVISTPCDGVEEKPYQCENRLGIFEALPTLFSNNFAQIEHNICLHKGGSACHYIITWQNPLSGFLRLLRNYTLLGSLLFTMAALLLMPPNILQLAILTILGVNFGINAVYYFQKTRELEQLVDYRHQSAEDQIESANTRYNNSLLVQEIGQATAAILDIHELMQELAVLMNNRLDFDRGLIMLTNKNRNRLIYSAGYGYSDNERAFLKKASFRLDTDNARGYFVKAFREQKHVIVTNAENGSDSLSNRSRQMLMDFSVHSLLCVPIVYKKTSLGILAVDNAKSRAPLKKSDIILLEGIASQIAISISNAVSFQKLRESEEKYRQTLESITEGYYEINLNKRIIFANNALCRLLDCKLQDLMNNKLTSFFPPSSLSQLNQLFENISITHEPVHFAHFDLQPPNNNAIPIDLSASLIIDQNGRARGYRGILRNATERLQLEKEKKELESRLLQAQKMEAIGTLAGGIAHNFNNWLAGILGNITLVRMDAKDHPKIVQRADRIDKIIENASKMTRQLLGYARAGNYEVRLLNVNDIIKEAAGTFAETKKEITINLSLDPELQMVKVDENQIEQVFWNMFVNAIDAMPQGGNLFIATANAAIKGPKGQATSVTPGEYVSITFKDNGIGIAPEIIDMIFEPFFTTKQGKGTGLGLASSFGIIKAHNGFIDVSSEQGVGTTFNIFLPVAEEPPEKETHSTEAVEKGMGTILIVDDESMILETNQQLLSRLGYNVLSASSGEEALAVFDEHRDDIDLIIIDMIMPGMSGRELHDRLKTNKPDVRTLLCSGYSLNENAREIMDQGCGGFLQKPFKISELSSIIKTILESEN